MIDWLLTPLFTVTTRNKLYTFKILYLNICVGKMNLSDEVDLEDYVARPDRISGKKLIINRL